jgi:hypothetical protein
VLQLAKLNDPLHYLLMHGDMPRGEFARMTGLGERTASTVLARLFKLGLLASDTPKGPDGHPKLLHVWPVKLLQAGRVDYAGSGLMDSRAAASLRR